MFQWPCQQQCQRGLQLTIAFPSCSSAGGIGSDGTDREGMLKAANGCNGNATGKGGRGPEQTRRSHGLTLDGRGLPGASPAAAQA
eukprot:4287305-Amphidinium_carterae.6